MSPAGLGVSGPAIEGRRDCGLGDPRAVHERPPTRLCPGGRRRVGVQRGRASRYRSTGMFHIRPRTTSSTTSRSNAGVGGVEDPRECADRQAGHRGQDRLFRGAVRLMLSGARGHAAVRWAGPRDLSRSPGATAGDPDPVAAEPRIASELLCVPPCRRGSGNEHATMTQSVIILALVGVIFGWLLPKVVDCQEVGERLAVRRGGVAGACKARSPADPTPSKAKPSRLDGPLTAGVCGQAARSGSPAGSAAEVRWTSLRG